MNQEKFKKMIEESKFNLKTRVIAHLPVNANFGSLFSVIYKIFVKIDRKQDVL